jgi:hypothetical protein
VVRVRAELDHKVEGTRLGPWSERLRLLHLAAPATPTLQTPANGSYVAGDGLELAWSDDSATFAWELRVSPSPALGDDGGLDTELGTPLLDPMVLLLIAGGTSGQLPRNIDLDEIDAVLDCTAFEDYVGGGPLPFVCADGSFTLPDTLADGDYYWQVRGYGIDSLAMGLEDSMGAWSAVGHFIVGEAPTTSEPGTDTPTSGSHPRTPSTVVDAAPSVESDVDGSSDGEHPTAESTDPDDESSSDTGSGSGADAADEATAAPTGDEFPFGWLFAGLGALVVLAGAGALIRFLVVRRR